MGCFDSVLLTVDFDRTLTGPDSQIPERNLTAIRYFMENGGYFTVNTGRSTTTFGKYLEVVPTNAPLLLYNGAGAWENGKLTDIRAIDLDMWQTIRKVAELFPDLNVEIQNERGHFLVNPKKSFQDFYSGVGWRWEKAVDGDDIGSFMKFALFGEPHKNTVADMFEGTEEELARFQEAEQTVRSLFGDKVVTSLAAPRILDVMPRGCSKLNAARALQKKLGCKILVCVGDAENDISMLDGADYAYCPQDAVVADRYETVCKCADGAVADVIYKKIPEILRNQP